MVKIGLKVIVGPLDTPLPPYPMAYRVAHSDFSMGGLVPPPQGGDLRGGGQWFDGGGFVRDSRQIRK